MSLTAARHCLPSSVNDRLWCYISAEISNWLNHDNCPASAQSAAVEICRRFLEDIRKMVKAPWAICSGANSSPYTKFQKA